jgi:spore germination cell wall hydrolase CwlJ-like protein
MKTLRIGLLATSLLLTGTLGTGTLAQATPVEARFTDIDCLARNIYHEARGEPLEGQIAVALVTLNRVQSPRYHNSVCGVVYAYKQFSWTLDKAKKIKDRKAWKASVDLATAVLTKSVQLPHFPALYFHTPQVNPRWNRGKRVVARIGNHIFYS